MRQKITRRIHDVDLPLAIRNADVDVQAEDQKRARDRLQFLNQQLVSFVIEDFLVLPTRNWMRRGGDNYQSALAGQTGNDAPQARDIRARFLNVLANAG